MKCACLAEATRAAPKKPPPQSTKARPKPHPHRFAKIPLQPKLAIGAVSDPLEREAERFAEGVTQTPNKAAPAPVEAPPSVHRTLARPGRPLDDATRERFEPRLGISLSAVRVHSDAAAAASAREISARAYTVGRNIVFDAGEFSPRLLAHELAHVAQQQATGVRRLQRAPSGQSLADAADPIEEESFPDYAWQKLITVETQGSPTGPHILGIVRENTDIPRDQLDGAGSKFTYRKFVRAGTIRPSYYSFTHAGKVVARAFAELDGYAAANKPSGKELLKEAHSYGVYAFLPVAGSSRERYSFPAPLSSASSAAAQPAQPAQPAPPRKDPRNSLPNLLVRWKYAGLLDPPALPPGVAPIPPYPVTKEQAEDLKQALAEPVAPYLVAGAVVPFTAAPATTTASTAAAALAETAPEFAAGTGGWSAAEVTGEVAAEQVGARTVSGTAVRTGLRVGAAAAAFITVLTWEGASAPGWTDLVSQITSEPFASAAEAAWESTLSQAQKDLLKELWRARDLRVEPRTREDDDKRRRSQCSPTGLSPDDPIPMAWYKPEVDNFYPATIEIQGHSYARDDPRNLPRGEPIGVPRQYWPRIGKTFQLLPVERGAGADEFRHTLTDYGFVWGGLQADHVQDLQWSGPDSFRNLWPLDMRQNPSAGTRQNNSQIVGACVSRRGPYVTRSILDLKRSGFFYGRWFSISRVEY